MTISGPIQFIIRILRHRGLHDTMALHYRHGMSPDKHLTLCSIADLRAQKKITKWIDELRDEVMAIDLHGKIIVTSSVCFHMGGEFDIDWKACQFRCRWHD